MRRKIIAVNKISIMKHITIYPNMINLHTWRIWWVRIKMFNMSLIIIYYVMLFIMCLSPLFVYFLFSIIEKRKERKRGKRLRFYYPFLDWCKYTRMENSTNRLMLNEEVENALLYSCPTIQHRLVHPFEDEKSSRMCH